MVRRWLKKLIMECLQSFVPHITIKVQQSPESKEKIDVILMNCHLGQVTIKPDKGKNE